MPHCNILYYCIRAVLSQSHKLCQIGGIAILFFCPPTLYPCGGQRLEQTGWGIKFIQSLPSKQMLPFNICFVLIEFSISMDYSNQKSARIQRECISIYLHAGMILMHCYQPQTQIFQEEHTPKSYGNIVAQAFRQQERKKKKKGKKQLLLHNSHSNLDQTTAEIGNSQHSFIYSTSIFLHKLQK